MKKLEGKIAIVTGSTRGIGCATAKMLAEEGAHVVVSGHNEEAGNRIADEICAEGGTAVYIQSDLSKMESTDALVESTVEKFGTIDILINCAAADDPMSCMSVQDIDEELYDYVMTVSVKVPFRLCQKVMPYMEAKHDGTIVNVCSIPSTSATFHKEGNSHENQDESRRNRSNAQSI